jgi:hypothetical protein
MLKQRNTKMQGNIGVGSAIQYFTSEAYIVSLPINDSQSYDLIVEKDGILKRVQVKTCRYKRGNNWELGLNTSGGNQSRNTKKIFDKSQVDLLFILVDSGERWVIPVDSLRGISTIKVGAVAYKEFMI